MQTTFSKKEIQNLKDESFFLQKRIITEKLFHELSETVKSIQSASSFKKISFPKGTDITRGKISKGENYLGLPFIILDFPKLFSQEEIFVFRTMIWWGNFVSCTLLISGGQVHIAQKKLLNHFSSLRKNNVFLCLSESPWHHHFSDDNFLLMKQLDKKEATVILSKQNFVKVARKIPMSEINRLQKFSEESFEILSVIST